MTVDPDTLLFVRFRDAADVGALGELYDRTAPELLRVAFHLVRDPVRAEDLVQQTFVAAIEGAARFDAARGVRGWLLGILANQAKKLQRDEARVPPAGGDVTIDPLAVAQTQEFTAAIDAAISTLPDVYQPVLVLHLKHGMIAAEIAHALRRPPGTVRTQLMRALELLKKALPPSIAVGACLLLTPLRGLAAVKASVLANAASHVAATAGATAAAAVSSGAAATATLAGGTVLMKKLVTAIACAIVLAVGAFVWIENRAADVAVGVHEAPVLAQATPVDDAAASPPPAPLLVPAARELKVAPTHGSLRYRFLWEEDRSPAASVWVHFVVWGRVNPHNTTIDVQTDASGEIALTELEPGNVGIYVDRAGGASPKIIAGEESSGTVLIPRGITVDVAVQDEQQQPIRGARVWLSRYGTHYEGHEVGATDATGRLTIRDVGAVRQIGARAAGYAPSDLARVEAKPGDRVALVLTVRGGGASLHGFVRDADARPVPGARVQIGGFGRVQEQEPGLVASSPPPPMDLRTDANGRYEVDGLPAEEILVRARTATSGTSWDLLTLGAGEARRFDVTLPACASIVGFVRDEEGRGLADASVGGGDGYGGFGYCSTRSGADGAFVLQGLPVRGRVGVSVSLARHLAAKETFALTAGEQRTFDFVLKASRAGDQISGVLVDEDERPLDKWIVNIRPIVEVAPHWSAYLPTDAEGRFVARGCPDRECVLEVFDPDAPVGPYPIVSQQPVRRGMNELRVRVPASALRFASLSGKVVDADGRPVGGAQVGVHDPDVSTFRQSPTDAGGGFRAERLPPRTYRIGVAASGLPVVDLGERALGPDERLDLGTIVLPRGGRVSLSCTIEPWDLSWSASLLAPDRECVARFGNQDHPNESRLLAPGRYELWIGGEHIAATMRDVEVTDGRTTNVEVALQGGVPYAIEVQGPESGWSRSDFEVTDGQGRSVFRCRELFAGHSRIVGLGIGTWYVRATADTGLTGTATIQVAEMTNATQRAVVDLK